MKKVIVLILCCSIAFVLTGCVPSSATAIRCAPIGNPVSEFVFPTHIAPFVFLLTSQGTLLSFQALFALSPAASGRSECVH